jgi:osmoprotectant transport system ATP-binding protein
VISFSHIYKSYDNVPILEDISLNVAEGELLVLLGASGSGKTTLLKMVNGLVDATDGDIKIENKLLQDLSLIEWRRNIGYVIQQVGLFPHYTVYNNIALMPRLKNWEEGKIKEAVKEWMLRLGLDYDLLAHKMPRSLSGGQVQRVGLARALITRPKILLMDEPFSALDPIIRKKIREEFREIQQKEKITTIMVTHDLQEAVSMADKICLMADKKIQQMDTPTALVFNPANSYVIDFIASDRFQAELGACTLKDIAPFLGDDFMVTHQNESLLQRLQNASIKENSELMNAFYKWKEQFS